ncbi:hypothetical protein AX15_004048 [Amanita polypyramis BW_CC]|nr:hypothetical protein AX15_004048 [Amanita polypyramis BW_CC]
MSALSPPLVSSGPRSALVTSLPLFSVKSVTCALPPQPAPSLSPPLTSSGPIATVKPGSSTRLLPSAQPAAVGVIRPMSAGLAAPGAPLALDPTSLRCIRSPSCRTPLLSRSNASTVLGPTLLHRKARLHHLKEAQASKAALKPPKPAKGKAKA